MSKRNPVIYIPTLYFAEGLPYAIAMSLSTVFFKSLGASNVFIGLATIISLPWTLKFMWAPLVDFIGSKRGWLLTAQLLLAVLMLVLALCVFSDQVINIALVGFLVIAIASATHDVAIDGYYLDVLNKDEQALFVGVRNAAYKVAVLFVSGAMVYVAGLIEKTHGLKAGWAASFIILAACLLLCFCFHSWYLPGKAKTSAEPEREKLNATKFVQVIFSYFNQKSIVAIVFYILIFRLGDALLLRQAQPFLMDSLDKGGLAVSVQELGLIYGTVGVVFLLIGGIIGGWLLCKGDLKRWLVPTALFQNSALLIYWWLAVAKPPTVVLYIANSVEQFAYGLGTAAYTVFILSTVKSEYKAAHYAVATALMACGQLVPGMLSGFMYEALGYANFFLVSFLLSIPGMVSIVFLPIWRQDESNTVAQDSLP